MFDDDDPDSRWLYLDTETTGLDHTWDEIVEIAIASPYGEPLLNTLVRPVRNRRWADAQAIHGISPEMVEDAPTLDELMPEIRRLVADRPVVIYNAGYDTAMLGSYALETAASIECCMLAWAAHAKVYNPRYRSWKWHRLSEAAAAVGHVWSGEAHRALADCLACRSVWLFLQRLARPW